MKVGVLAVQGAVSEHLGHLGRCGVEAVAVKEKTALGKVGGLIIPGGESTTIGKLLEIFGLAESIKARCCDGSLAVFGTCAGMVLMAEEVTDGLPDQPHLGLMSIKVKRNAFGRQKESFETELQFDSFEPALTAVFIRAPKIEEAAAGVEVLARLEEGIVAARQGLMLTTSFHPELTDDLRVHRYFIEICRSI
jgi:pyridoxal 5'-phosphate synthase pdxT subunit